MTITSTARAPTPAGPERRPPPRRRALSFAVAIAVAVGVAAATTTSANVDDDRDERARVRVTATAAGRPSAPAVDPRPTRVARDRRPSPALRPTPPADGRDAPDPFVLRDGDRYVLYTTQVGWLNVPVASSPDLAVWSEPTDAMPELPSWVEWGYTWAPGVVRRRTHYVLYFAARARDLGVQCIGVAVAHRAEGPFVSEAATPLVCQPDLGGSIDPHPFVDRDGSAYLFWKADANAVGRPTPLFVQRLRPDGLALVGEPVALLASGARWEAPLIENPAFVAAGPSYLLLYSGGRWESDSYAVGYAVCESPLGPCTRVTVDGPVLASTDDEAGPGGASLVLGPAGERWIAYHAWTPGAVGYEAGGARSLHFARLAVDGGRLVLDRTEP